MPPKKMSKRRYEIERRLIWLSEDEKKLFAQMMQIFGNLAFGMIDNLSREGIDVNGVDLTNPPRVPGLNYNIVWEIIQAALEAQKAAEILEPRERRVRSTARQREVWSRDPESVVPPRYTRSATPPEVKTERRKKIANKIKIAIQLPTEDEVDLTEIGVKEMELSLGRFTEEEQHDRSFHTRSSIQRATHFKTFEEYKQDQNAREALIRERSTVIPDERHSLEQIPVGPNDVITGSQQPRAMVPVPNEDPPQRNTYPVTIPNVEGDLTDSDESTGHNNDREETKKDK